MPGREIRVIKTEQEGEKYLRLRATCHIWSCSSSWCFVPESTRIYETLIVVLQMKNDTQVWKVVCLYRLDGFIQRAKQKAAHLQNSSSFSPCTWVCTESTQSQNRVLFTCAHLPVLRAINNHRRYAHKMEPRVAVVLYPCVTLPPSRVLISLTGSSLL